MINLLYRSKKTLLTAILGWGALSAAQAQCTVSLNATPNPLPCGGGLVTFTAASSGGSTFALNNDFNLGNAGSGWTVSPAGVFNNPCGPSLDGTTYMWMGNTTAAPRTLQSAPLDVSCGGNICFDFKMAEQGTAAPCEGPDQANEGIYIQWSLDAITWSDIFYFQPNINGSFNSASPGSGDYTAWFNYCYPIPLAAQTTATYFRWYQDGSSGTCCDHWGIDNVTISSTGCVASYYYNWGDTTLIGSQDSTGSFFVQNDSTVTVMFTNGVDDTCTATVNITTLGLMQPGLVVADELCQFANDGSIQITPVDGQAPYTYVLNGPGGTQTNGTGLFGNLQPGNYTIDITDALGCTWNEPLIVVGPGPTCCSYTVATSYTDVSCNGGANGDVYAAATGGMYPPMTYAWYDTGGNPLGVTDSFMTNLPAGQYVVEILDTAMCLQQVTLTVNEPAPISTTIAVVDAVCNGYSDGQAFSVPVGGTPGVAGYTYEWNGGMANSNQLFDSIPVGNYTLSVFDSLGCQFDTSFVVGQPALLTVDNLVMSDELCLNNCTGTIDVTAALADSFSIDGGLTYQTTGTFTNLCSGMYSIMVADSAGCFDTSSIAVGSPAPVDLTTVPDTAICTGGTADLIGYATGGVNGFTYYWDQGLGTGQNQQVGTLGTWNVYALDANGCSTDTLPITVAQSPALDVVAVPDIEICWGESATISAVASGGNFGPYTYTWDNGAGVGQTQTVAPTVSTTYEVTVSDGCGTTPDTDQVLVTVHQLPPVTMTVDIPVACSPNDVILTNTTDPNYVGPSALWYFGDNSLPEQGLTSLTHQYVNPGCYDVTLIVESPEGCIDSSTVSDLVCVWPLPVANFEFGPQPTTILESEITFTNVTSGAVTYQWFIDGVGYSTTDEHFSYAFPDDEPGTYSVCLDAWTDNNCHDSVCYTVAIDPSFHLYAPNAITADGDGMNDFFFIQGRSIDESDFELFIFDRWGKQVFYTQDLTQPWDGTTPSERKLETEVFVWKVVTKDKFGGGDKKTYTGHVTVLR